MHNAPAVSYPVGRSPFQAALVMAIVVAGALAQGVWWLQSIEHGVGHGMGWLLWLGFAIAALRALWRTPQRQLVWDGQDWRLHAGLVSLWVTPQVILDAQRNMLVLLRPAAAPALWVWPAQQMQPERWLALRRALFHLPPVTGPDASSVAVSPKV